MITLLADANIQGQVALMVSSMQSETWREFWDYLNLQLATFGDVGLDPADSDAIVWQRCQDLGMLLLTDNRNDDGPESLQSTIKVKSTSASLPVFTIGDPRRIVSSAQYRHDVIDRLLRYLLELDSIRGTGRLFLP